MLKHTGFVSRYEAENMDPKLNWAIISIYEPDSDAGPANLKPGWVAVLRLPFHDIEPGWEHRYPEYPDLEIFEERHARHIVEFVQEHAASVDGILVHCKAGVSRSAAVSRWIAETYGLPYNERYSLYNKHVYRELGDYTRKLLIDQMGDDSHE